MPDTQNMTRALKTVIFLIIPQDLLRYRLGQMMEWRPFRAVNAPQAAPAAAPAIVGCRGAVTVR